MKADMDPELEATVTRLLHVLQADTRVMPWNSPVVRVEQAARRQRRVRATVGAAGLAVAVAASVVGIGLAAGSPSTITAPVGTPATSVPTSAQATSAPLVPQPSGNPSTAIVVPSAVLSRVAAESASRATAVASALALPPDTTPIPASALPALRTLAWQTATAWGDKAATLTAIHVADSTSVFAALGLLGSTPRLDSYLIEVKGHLVCRSCSSFGMPVQVLSAYYLFVDAHTLHETQASAGSPAMDLSRFGVASTIAPLDATATPRPVGPTLAPLRPGQAVTLDEVKQYALQGADDPTTAQVVFTREVLNSDLKASAQNVQGPDSQRVFVVGVRGARTSMSGNTITEWEMIVPETFGTGGGFCPKAVCAIPWPSS